MDIYKITTSDATYDLRDSRVDGLTSGSETESDDFIVTVTATHPNGIMGDTVWVADKTVEEIIEAFNQGVGKPCWLVGYGNGARIPLMTADRITGAIFGNVYIDPQQRFARYMIIKPSGEVKPMQYDELATATEVAEEISTHNADTSAHQDIRNIINNKIQYSTSDAPSESTAADGTLWVKYIN